MRTRLAAASAVLFLLAAMGKMAPFPKQAIGADQRIVIVGADYNSTNVTAYSSGLASIAGNVTKRIVIEYADFNIEHGLNSSDALRKVAATVAPRIVVEYADYLFTNGFVTYIGPNNGSDTDPPSIGTPTRDPSGYVIDGQSVNVSVQVSDSVSGVKNATLEYNLNNGTVWVTLRMNLNLTVHPSDSLLFTYYAAIPGQPSGTFVRFRIVAWDYAENNATRDGVSYRVGDFTPPNIGNPTQEPPANMVRPNQNVTISVNITDAETGVKNATLEYRINNTISWNSTKCFNSTSSLYYATILGQFNWTQVTYRIIAYDNAGNHNMTQNYSYTVIPEFPSTIVLSLFMMITMSFAFIACRRRRTRSLSCELK